MLLGSLTMVFAAAHTVVYALIQALVAYGAVGTLVAFLYMLPSKKPHGEADPAVSWIHCPFGFYKPGSTATSSGPGSIFSILFFLFTSSAGTQTLQILLAYQHCASKWVGLPSYVFPCSFSRFPNLATYRYCLGISDLSLM